MRVIRDYKGSHHDEYEYKKVDLYCPHCGKQELWTDQGDGDYYIGVESICVACGGSAYLDHICIKLEEAVDILVLEQLRSGITHTPTTKRGS